VARCSTLALDSTRSWPSAPQSRSVRTTAIRWAGSPAASLPTGPRLNAPSSSRSGSAASTPPRPSWALLGRRYTWNHLGLDRLPPAQVAAEVDCTNRLLARLAGRPVRLLRPPDGAYDKTVVDLLATRRLQLILWTVDSRDWARPGVRRILATVARELRPGAIILLHDGGGDRSQTVAALPALLRQLHARGYRAVALPPVQRGRPNGQAGRRPGRSRCGRCGWRMWCCKRTVTAVR
jgi:hypothetical protein